MGETNAAHGSGSAKDRCQVQLIPDQESAQRSKTEGIHGRILQAGGRPGAGNTGRSGRDIGQPPEVGPWGKVSSATDYDPDSRMLIPAQGTPGQRFGKSRPQV